MASYSKFDNNSQSAVVAKGTKERKLPIGTTTVAWLQRCLELDDF